MWRPDKETVDQLRQEYPEGARVELVYMDDFDPIPIGTQGTVKGVNFLGDICVDWDNGRSLKVVYGIDRCRLIPPNETATDFVKK